jgi:hypothetical protein
VWFIAQENWGRGVVQVKKDGKTIHSKPDCQTHAQL